MFGAARLRVNYGLHRGNRWEACNSNLLAGHLRGDWAFRKVTQAKGLASRDGQFAVAGCLEASQALAERWAVKRAFPALCLSPTGSILMGGRKNQREGMQVFQNPQAMICTSSAGPRALQRFTVCGSSHLQEGAQVRSEGLRHCAWRCSVAATPEKHSDGKSGPASREGAAAEARIGIGIGIEDLSQHARRRKARHAAAWCREQLTDGSTVP